MSELVKFVGGMKRPEPSTLEITYYLERLSESYGKVRLLDEIANTLSSQKTPMFYLLDLSTTLPDAVDNITPPSTIPMNDVFFSMLPSAEDRNSENVLIHSATGGALEDDVPTLKELAEQYKVEVPKSTKLVKSESSHERDEKRGDPEKGLTTIADSTLSIIREKDQPLPQGTVYYLNNKENIDVFFKKFRRLKRPNIYGQKDESTLQLLYNYYSSDALTVRSFSVNSPFTVSLQGAAEILDVLLSEGRKREEHQMLKEAHAQDMAAKKQKAHLDTLEQVTRIMVSLQNPNLPQVIRSSLENQALAILESQQTVNRAIGVNGRLDTKA